MTPERAALLLLRFHYEYPVPHGSAILERVTAGEKMALRGLSLLVFRCAVGGNVDAAAAEVAGAANLGKAVVSLWDKVREKFPVQAAALEGT
jgi:hypothetical protein